MDQDGPGWIEVDRYTQRLTKKDKDRPIKSEKEQDRQGKWKDSFLTKYRMNQLNLQKLPSFAFYLRIWHTNFKFRSHFVTFWINVELENSCTEVVQFGMLFR